MNSVTARPAYEMALETTIAALQAVRADGADNKALLGVLRAKMWDESFLDKSHRQTFLKRVNEALDQRPPFSMNQVRKADPTMLAAATSTDINKLIQVDELHGEVNLDNLAPAGSLEMLPESAPVTRESTDSISSTLSDDTAAVGDATQTNSNTSQEQDAMNTSNDNITIRQAAALLNPHVAPNSPALHVVSTEESEMPSTAPKSKFDQFLAKLVQAGYANASERDELYNAFLANHLNFASQAQAVAQAAEAGLTNDAQFFEFITQVKDAEVAFHVFLGAYVPAEPTAEERSQFSFRGERDDGVRAGWVAVGSALLGAALETGHRGTLSIGSGVGALVGVVGSYFAGEMLDKQIDSQFGRYVAAGTLGLAAGALGSGAGRLAQGAVMGNVAQESDGTPVLPTPASTPAIAPSVAAMLGLAR